MKQTIRDIQRWLNEVHPTRGDGCWGAKFIEEVLSGKHGEMKNAKYVWDAVRWLNPELMGAQYEI